MSGDKTEKKPFLTERETEVLAKSWLCMASQPEINMEKLASLTGYNNPRSVSNLFGVIRKKIAAQVAESGEVVVPLTPKKAKGGANGSAAATPGSRKRKTPASAANGIGDGADEVDAPTPTKRGRKKAVKAEEPAAENGNGVHDDVKKEEKPDMDQGMELMEGEV